MTQPRRRVGAARVSPATSAQSQIVTSLYGFSYIGARVQIVSPSRETSCSTTDGVGVAFEVSYDTPDCNTRHHQAQSNP